MKTGTAAERGRGYHVNYIGVGPLPDPTVAFCVRVTHERSSPAVTRGRARGDARACSPPSPTGRASSETAARRPAPERWTRADPTVQTPSRTWTAGRALWPGARSARSCAVSDLPDTGPRPPAGTGGADRRGVGEARLRILVADDEEGVLLALKEYLGCCGWDVDAALTATEAERLLETRGYAAVITDLRFSGPSGDGRARRRPGRADAPPRRAGRGDDRATARRRRSGRPAASASTRSCRSPCRSGSSPGSSRAGPLGGLRRTP